MEKYLYPSPLKKEWISEQIIDDKVVEWAQSFGKFLTETSKHHSGYSDRPRNIKPLTTSQIRKFFGELKRIQSDYYKHRTEVPLIKAKLAYAVGRDFDKGLKRSKSKIQEFYEELSKGLDEIKDNKENFKTFVKIVEAIVAFHKFHGGEDN
jgi:CRISPR-associated protein Csm2